MRCWAHRLLLDVLEAIISRGTLTAKRSAGCSCEVSIRLRFGNTPAPRGFFNTIHSRGAAIARVRVTYVASGNG